MDILVVMIALPIIAMGFVVLPLAILLCYTISKLLEMIGEALSAIKDKLDGV